MESFGNEIRVQQGEDWNLDLLLSGSNREYIPFIVPQAMPNPYFCITVGSTKYEKNYRYVKTWWNEYTGPKFKSTTPIYYGEVEFTNYEVVDLGIRTAHPSSFNYRDYSDVEVIDLGTVSNYPYADNFQASGAPGVTADQVDIVYNSSDSYIDSVSNPKIYKYKYTTPLGGHYTEYARVDSYRGLKLARSNSQTNLQVKVVEIGFQTGGPDDYNVNYFTDTSDTNRIYTYWLYDGIDANIGTRYYKQFNYELEVLETVFTSNVLLNLPTRPSVDPRNPTYGDNINNRNLYYYTKADEEIDPTTGHKPYHYFYFEYASADVSTAELVDGYECELIQNFTTNNTNEWNGQNYMYQITLVTGQLMANYLQEQYEDKVNNGYDMSDYPSEIAGNPQKTNELRYKYFKARWPNMFQADINADSPLGTIENLIPILSPTKLEVYNNIRRLI